MIAALLALAVSGLTAATYLQNRKIELKREAGVAEATILDRLRHAVNAAMSENLPAIQQGGAVVKAEQAISPETIAGELVWRPSIAQLKAMGYLPEGWSAATSSINGAAYAVSFRRTPSGCMPAACEVEGQIVITRPILDGGAGAPVDGILIGPILTRMGADGGVSLATSPGVITGFGNTWTLPNPIPGNPAGVVALRVGTNTAGLNQFVRIGDLRDPSLGGNLSAAGNLNIAGASSLNGPLTLNGSMTANDASGVPCVTVDRAGVVNVACAGTLNARTGAFSEQVTVGGGITSGTAILFAPNDPNAIRVAGGEMFIRGASGNLVTFRGGNVVAEGSIGGTHLALTRNITEGSSCGSSAGDAGSTQYSALSDGSLAACVAGKWVVISRLGGNGDACSVAGATAVDKTSGNTLICRGTRYAPMAALLSNFVLMETLAISMSGSSVYVNKPSCDKSFNSSEPLIILTPNNEGVLMVSASVASGVNRYAIDIGLGWDVHLERSADSMPLLGNLIANIYCYYE